MARLPSLRLERLTHKLQPKIGNSPDKGLPPTGRAATAQSPWSAVIEVAGMADRSSGGRPERVASGAPIRATVAGSKAPAPPGVAAPMR